MQKKLVILGSINIDHIIRVDNLPKPGQTILGHDYLTSPGGKGANQAVAAGRYGIPVHFLAAIGEDTIGASMCDQFQKDGVMTDKIEIVKNASTGLAMIMVDSCAENVITIYTGANDSVNQAYVEKYSDDIKNADILLMQLETPLDGIIAAANIAKAHETYVVLNPAPAKSLPLTLLAHVDMITPNETEAEQLTGIAITNDDSAQKASNIFHDMGIESVIITLGARGVWLSQKKQGYRIPAFKVDAIDTIAAGDTFNAILVSELLVGSDLHNAIIHANAAAAIAVTRKGAQLSIPWHAEVKDFLRKNQNNMSI